MGIYEEIAKDILDTKREIVGSENVVEEYESFGMNLIPLSSPETFGFHVVKTFSVVLKGLLLTKDVLSYVNVLKTTSSENGQDFSHNFFLYSISSRYGRSIQENSKISIYSFIKAGTSGYAGAGSEVNDEIHKIIRENEDELAFREIKITLREDRSLQESFREKGPILIAGYPNDMEQFE